MRAKCTYCHMEVDDLVRHIDIWHPEELRAHSSAKDSAAIEAENFKEDHRRVTMESLAETVIKLRKSNSDLAERCTKYVEEIDELTKQNDRLTAVVYGVLD